MKGTLTLVRNLPCPDTEGSARKGKLATRCREER
jgi:hypothetical protein